MLVKWTHGSISARQTKSSLRNLHRQINMHLLSNMAHKPRASYQICKLVSYTCAGNTGNVSSATNLKWNHLLFIPACTTAHTWPLSDRKPMGLLSDSGHARAVMHAGITNPRWRGKRSRQSRRMRKTQFYLSGQSPIQVSWHIYMSKNCVGGC